MFGIINYGAFIAAAVLLNLTPGVDTLYILGKSVTGGPRVGIASALGISSGLVVHTLLAAFGLSIVLVSSPWLFWAVKLLGCCYLVILGLRALLSRNSLLVEEDAAQRLRALPVYLQGILVNVTNPKIALFFLAFLPQFVDPALMAGAGGPDAAVGIHLGGIGATSLPFLLLGATFICTSTLWCLVLAFGAGQFKRLLERRTHLAATANKVAGLLYIALGLSIFATPLPG
ncbi:MAG: LysE family translocator [Coriobacteriales bacterium]|jgi:threonine/homoserine/homoserine lactone efflux protein|nr:LysE family translocator [Coriobacteriales bacterium]